MRSTYGAADFFINPLVTRRDEQLDAILGAELSVYRALSLDVSVTYTRNDSNLPNFEYNNLSGGVHLLLRY